MHYPVARERHLNKTAEILAAPVVNQPGGVCSVVLQVNCEKVAHSFYFLVCPLFALVTRSSSLARQAEAFFFERNQDIAAVNILTGEDFKSSARSAKESSIINNRFFISNEID